jgi:hypothetical protein
MEPTFDADRVLLLTLFVQKLQHYLTLRTARQRADFSPLLERLLAALGAAHSPPSGTGTPSPTSLITTSYPCFASRVPQLCILSAPTIYPTRLVLGVIVVCGLMHGTQLELCSVDSRIQLAGLISSLSSLRPRLP